MIRAIPCFPQVILGGLILSENKTSARIHTPSIVHTVSILSHENMQIIIEEIILTGSAAGARARGVCPAC